MMDQAEPGQAFGLRYDHMPYDWNNANPPPWNWADSPCPRAVAQSEKIRRAKRFKNRRKVKGARSLFDMALDVLCDNSRKDVDIAIASLAGSSLLRRVWDRIQSQSKL